MSKPMDYKEFLRVKDLWIENGFGDRRYTNYDKHPWECIWDYVCDQDIQTPLTMLEIKEGGEQWFQEYVKSLDE